MNKMTFKQFLMEVDVGDLQLAKQHRDQQAAQAQAGAFKKEMTGSTPVEGDVIQTQSGTFQVVGLDVKKIHLRELGGQKRTAALPQGTKFEPTGQKTQAGQSIFKLTK